MKRNPIAGDNRDDLELKKFQYDPDTRKSYVNIDGTVEISNALFSKAYNKITVLSKNEDGNPLTIQTYIDNTPVQLLTISYDVDGDFESAEVVDV